MASRPNLFKRSYAHAKHYRAEELQPGMRAIFPSLDKASTVLAVKAVECVEDDDTIGRRIIVTWDDNYPCTYKPRSRFFITGTRAALIVTDEEF